MPSTPIEELLDVNVVKWADAYLLHLARQHGLALASLESRMSNLDDAVKPVLFVVG